MKGKKLFVLAAGLLLSVTALAGCGKKKADPTPDPTPGPGPVEPEPGPDPVAEPATGTFSYANSSNADRTEILGVLEKWAVDKKLTGMTIYEDGGYVMYSPDVEKGAPNYIKGYGFGTLAEGRITKDLKGETEEVYKRYYHTYEASDPASVIYMDDDGGVVPSLVGYIAGGFYDTVMNATRTGYKWVGDLATNDAPIAVNPDEDGASSVYRFPVKTGAALKYSTNTNVESLKAFNNREVELDDYLTPYKLYYTSFYGMKRNAEIKDSSAGSIKGGEAYSKASKDGYTDELWAGIGIKAGHSDELGDYLEFTLNAPVTPFWARYYIGGSMYAPVPKAFIEALGALESGGFNEGVKIWGKFNSDASLSPVDTYLSTGPYVLKEWKKDLKITYSRNPNYISGEDRATTRPSSYNIEGVYIAVLKSLTSDPEAALKEFEAEKLHACGIPSTQIETYVNDPRTTIVPGSTTTKLNFNTCDAESWEALFGENGSITQTPKDKYWKLKPAMQNKNFLDGMSYAVDRKSYAAKLGRTPSNNYFGSGYYSDPEEGIFYNDTDAHKAAVAESLEGTDGYGFSLEKAKVAFKKAAEELIAENAYEVGDTIKIEMAWQGQANVAVFGEPLCKMIVDAFDAAETGLHLEFTHDYGPDYTYVYYNKMMIGQFDIGFGGIEGNSYNPLNFMEVLKSDNSSRFTLNWGIPTNEYVELEWDGKLWTYDALWEVADHGGYVEGGKNVPTFDFQVEDIARQEDGSLVIDGALLAKKHLDEEGNVDFETSMTSICLYGEIAQGYAELYAYVDGTTDLSYDAQGELLPEETRDVCVWEFGQEADENGYISVKITLSAAFMAAFLTYFPDDATITKRAGIDVYKNIFMFGEDSGDTYHGTPWEWEAGDFTYVPAN